MKRAILIGSVAVLIALGIAATKLTALQGTAPGLSPTGETAPEFTGIDTWLNSEPLTMKALRGKVVWIDFWTYSCINCIRTLPSVRAFYARYHALGLDIVGVHSPEFDFEKIPANVRASIARYHIPYPVAMDSEMATWRAYGNSYWPRVYLVDAKGAIRYDHAGEGGDDEIEKNLRALLTESGAQLPPPLNLSEDPPSARTTPEIYAGYERGSQQLGLANPEGYSPHAVATYRPVTSETIAQAGTDGAFFLEGAWRAENEYVEASTDGARVILPFAAKHAYMVAAPASGSLSVAASIDGKKPAFVSVGGDDLFTLFEGTANEHHVLTLTASKGFRLYTFTFG